MSFGRQLHRNAMGAAARTAKPQGYCGSGYRAGGKGEGEQRAGQGVTSEPRDRAAGGSKAALWRSCGCDGLQKGRSEGGPAAPGPAATPGAAVVPVMTGQVPGAQR